jgi:hypothetical protein
VFVCVCERESVCVCERESLCVCECVSMKFLFDALGFASG